MCSVLTVGDWQFLLGTLLHFRACPGTLADQNPGSNKTPWGSGLRFAMLAGLESLALSALM